MHEMISELKKAILEDARNDPQAAAMALLAVSIVEHIGTCLERIADATEALDRRDRER